MTCTNTDHDNYVAPIAGQPRLVYVAGPIRLGNVWDNLRTGMLVAMRLHRAGWIPFCPHLSALLAMVAGEPGGDDHPDGACGWLEYDFRLIARCDVLVRIPGRSSGADREVALAHHLGIPVLTEEEALDRAANGTYGTRNT